MSDNQKATSALNYEAMYNQLQDKYNCLMEKHAYIESELRDARAMNRIYEAQIEIVRLIFGGDGK